MADYAEMERTLTELLRLEQFPVAWKFANEGGEFSGIRIPKRKLYSCQMMKIASEGGYVLGATDNELACSQERLAFGMEEVEEKHIQALLRRYVRDRDTAERWLREVRPSTKCQGIMVGRLGRVRFVPDILLLMVNAWQATRCIHAYAYHSGQDLHFVTGFAACPCAYGAVYVYQAGKPNLVTGCSGAREYGKFAKDELAFFMPFKDIGMFIEGLRATHQRGLRVPLLLDLGYPPTPPRSILE